MSHIYQPVMLVELLERGGTATVNQIARTILQHDPSQIEYYEQITRRMPGRVLTKNRGITTKEGDSYHLTRFEELSKEETQALITACKQRLSEYEEARGKKIWEHRTKSSGYISGSIRYEVLKRAKFRCELCGISAEEKALEVDHIVPRNNDGTDEIINLQALCYSCNSMKRDTDATDFRGIAESYQIRGKGCVFCEGIADRIVEENQLAFAIRDGFPVSPFHTLVIPKRHVSTYFELYQPELNAINQLLASQRTAITALDSTVTGFNVGVNNGADAGQTVMHCHVHLIPRRSGDVENPRGGVRGVIPSKQNYASE